MKFNFNKPKEQQGKRKAVGLDIGTGYIKLVVVRDDHGQAALDNFYLAPLSKNIAQDLSQAADELQISQAAVNIALSGPATIVRNLWMPRMKADELKASLKYELDQYVPFPLEDIYYDCCVLEDGPANGKEGQMRVVLTVVKKKFLDERLQQVQQAGLAPEVISVDAVSLYNAYEKSMPEEGAAGLVDLGSRKTIINIISGNILMFTREIEYGTMQIRKAVSRGLEVDNREAEKLICSRDEKTSQWVRELGFKLGRELWSSFEYHEHQEQKPVEKVYITGGGSLLPELMSSLGSTVGIPIAVWEPATKLPTGISDNQKQRLRANAPLFGIAAGLAYRSI